MTELNSKETAEPESAKQESGSHTWAFFVCVCPPPPQQGRNCCKRNTGCYQPRAGAAVCSLSQPSCNRRLFSDKQDASISPGSFPVLRGEGQPRAVPGGRTQVHPSRAGGEHRAISFLQPLLMAKQEACGVGLAALEREV